MFSQGTYLWDEFFRGRFTPFPRLMHHPKRLLQIVEILLA